MNATALFKCELCPSLEKGVFCDLEKDLLDEVSAHKVTNRYKKGQSLFVQGNPPFGLFCISKGNVKITKVGANGEESIVKIAKEGDILGHRSLITEEFYSATATAIEDCTVCFIDKKYVMKLIEKNSSVSMHFIKRLSRDMGAAENKVASLHQKNVRERLAELLLILKQSHGIKLEKKWELDIKLTREEMASMIGTANETLIRFMSEFREEGLIDQVGKKIFITNESRLIEWANLKY